MRDRRRVGKERRERCGIPDDMDQAACFERLHHGCEVEDLRAGGNRARQADRFQRIMPADALRMTAAEIDRIGQAQPDAHFTHRVGQQHAVALVGCDAFRAARMANPARFQEGFDFLAALRVAGREDECNIVKPGNGIEENFLLTRMS